MICPICKVEVDKLTRDHVVPKWFIKRVGSLGISMKKYPYPRIQMVCSACNSRKGGDIHWHNVQVREYMHLFATTILDKLKDTAA